MARCASWLKAAAFAVACAAKAWHAVEPFFSSATSASVAPCWMIPC
jgi:hypothetical protein